MFDKIFFDHAFIEDPSHTFFKRLEKLGFILSEMKVEHPGKAHCRFIELDANTNRKLAYLEFVSVGKGGYSFKSSGLSLGYREKLENYYKKLSKRIKVDFNHKNYDWKNNNTDHLPGWNMLTLKNPPIRNIYTWFTEYEKHPETKKKTKSAPKHPNSVYGIYGLELTLTEKGRTYLSKVLGKEIKNKMKLKDGTILFIQRGKVNRFNNIILKCKSLKKANKFIKNKESHSFEKLEALMIENKNDFKKMWSLIIIQA
ncbi:hypothetical protein A9Q84_14115 [Halobacteriovorax marinus]|uniref:Glyoxalase-like domain-containing protein n=1 Tax=Halobacteriovorax marinus TaxID=97084 RepID=A0A1Y5F8N9_9BACT|nr:hypothetical protein A9Q84_14115 [Halobacteriovorax marinus]